MEIYLSNYDSNIEYDYSTKIDSVNHSQAIDVSSQRKWGSFALIINKDIHTPTKQHPILHSERLRDWHEE